MKHSNNYDRFEDEESEPPAYPQVIEERVEKMVEKTRNMSLRDAYEMADKLHTSADM